MIGKGIKISILVIIGLRGLNWGERGLEIYAEDTPLKNEYVWYDEDNKQVAYLQKNLLAYFGSTVDEKKLVFKKLVIESQGVKIVEVSPVFFKKQMELKYEKGGSDFSPVFSAVKEKSQPMALPGGILVYLDTKMTDEDVRQWAIKNQLKLRNKVLLLKKNAWVLETDRGLISLTLANSLRRMPDVLAAMPNWWRQFSLR